MTTGDLGRGLGSGDLGDDQSGQALARSDPAVSIEETLGLVDRILAERGRRRHLFGWLKVPGGGSEDWLAVDAYYPGHRLVVVCEGSSEHAAVFRELVPAHGLRLLEVGASELSGGREAARAMLERRLAELAPPRRPVASASASHSSPAAEQRPAARPKAGGESEAAGVLAGLALAAALVIEIYFGVARLGFGSGNLLLAFGLSLDACSRALGTLAAWRAGEREWAWWCALGGSPLTVGFALMQNTGPVKTEPAPLAGMLGVGGILLLALALVVSALGG
jgi:hypothetical protein